MPAKKRQPARPKNESTEEAGKLFTQKLLNWNQSQNKRQMPWKGEKDPYKIWLSEVILQQTRVEQGMKYYENFITTFSSVHELANAPEEKVFKQWEGLGYYSRCRNLIWTAKYISEKLNGVFPSDFESILQLKGVGNYTASAIASFAYNLPYAVLDGNVFRVLSRIFDIETPIDSLEGKKQFAKLAQELLPKKKAGAYNQAIMDFGATVCKPYPECFSCFFQIHCKAYLLGKQDVLPIKQKKINLRERWFNYVVAEYKGEVLVHQRISKDIWQNLFEFILIETETAIAGEKILFLLGQQYGIVDFKTIEARSARQRLTHQLIHFCFLRLELKNKHKPEGFKRIKKTDLSELTFPKTLQEFVANNLK